MKEDIEKVTTYPCPLCTVPFKSKKKRKLHKKKVHPKCGYCQARFSQQKQLESHQRQVGHGYCHECNLCFSKSSFSLHHVRTVEHAETFQCCDCGRNYFDQKSLKGHCCDCDIVFKRPEGLQSHLKTSKAHKPRASVPRIDVLGLEGLQRFHNPAQEQRQGSQKTSAKKSRGKKTKKSKPISCLAGEECKKQFCRPSGLLHHLESGSCRSGMTRQKLNSLVLVHDQGHYITTEDGSSATSEQNSLCDTPSSTLSARSASHSLDEWDLLGSPDFGPFNSSTDEIRLHATTDENSDSNDEWMIIHSAPRTPSISEWSIVGSTSEVAPSFGILCENLRCTLCPLAKPRFCNVRALLAHMASAAHDSKLFHCPMTFEPEKKSSKSHVERRFSTLGGLAQHVESGACRGNETFRLVFQYVEDQLSLLGFQGVKLLF